MKTSLILVVSNQVVQQNSKINWPDLNYPNSGQTILRTIYKVDYEKLKIQLDSADGPWFDSYHFPEGVGFYSKVVKPA
jgi:hypothetical protein